MRKKPETLDEERLAVDEERTRSLRGYPYTVGEILYEEACCSPRSELLTILATYATMILLLVLMMPQYGEGTQFSSRRLFQDYTRVGRPRFFDC